MAKKSKADDGEELPQQRRCATDQMHMKLLLESPEYASRRAAIENQAWRAQRAPIASRAGCTRIPVVVHVVHRTAAENVSKAQIDSQIDVLNDDFRRRNGDIGDVPAAFQPFTADARIEFALAETDPDGNDTDGITRTETSVNGFGPDDDMKASSSGGADPWPSDRYLNMWVCKLAGGLLGYAQFPGGPAATDGVVITHTAFGTTGTAAAPFDGGRTAVHEVGHWLNLRHIWGDDAGGCSGSDFVDDTPNQAGSNTGTPAFPSVSCGNGPDGDMFMNYMDYVDDAAMMMFTAGQVTRMQAALDGPRSSIGATTPCQGVKAKFADDPIKMKFRDDPPKFKFRDDVKSPAADPKFKFRDDPPKSKFRDDPPKLKFRDDPPKFKFQDDLGKPPGLDPGGFPGGGGFPGPATPFILATPHHSGAWQQSYPEAAAASAQAYEQELAAYEQTLTEYARADEAGELTNAERDAAERLHAEYARLAAEYQQFRGGA